MRRLVIANPSQPSKYSSETSRPKRQHYVSQKYLRSFTGTDGKLRVFELDAGKEFRTSTTNAAVENYYYDLEIEGERLSAEDLLTVLEGEAWPVIERLVADPQNASSLTVEEETSLSRFIASFRFRTPAFREWEREMASSVISQVKDMTRKMLYAKLGRKNAEDTWREWQAKPDHWWLREEEPLQPASTAIYMLAQVVGFGNLIRAMPWRIGRTTGELRLYTSDNPLSGHLSPVRPWWEGGAFASFTYYFPLSPATLLKVSPMTYPDEAGSARNPQGDRRHRDFSDWEISITRHVITSSATKYLYGEGLMVSRQCATDCLERIDRFNLQFALRYQGFDPRPPSISDDADG